MMSTEFKVAFTADFFNESGETLYQDIGLSVLENAPGIQQSVFGEHRKEITPDQLAGSNGVIVLTPRITAKSLSDADDLVAIGRFGVGYDTVDVAACTEADVALFITAGAVDYSVAEASLTWMLGLGHHLTAKDRLVREGAWDERSGLMGSELRDRTVSLIGFGGIARRLAEMVRVFGPAEILAFDPYVKEEDAAAAGVRLVTLDEALERGDYVSVHCPLTESTRGLIGAKQLAKMRPSAYLLNTARGGIVDEAALTTALEEKRIAGAALDCFEDEPVTEPHPLGRLDNVILAPHSIAWTHELFRDIGRSACQGMVDMAGGKTPRGIVNREVLEKSSFQEKWKRILGRD
ncbi:MAG: NAD(P)-dependent oxidoreductase [Verrucomicrobiota bacterium]